MLIVLSASGGWAFLNRDSIPTLLQRAFGKEIAIPRDTRIVKIPQIEKVGIGDDVTMEFFVETKKSSELKGILKIHYSSNQKMNLPLTKDENIRWKVFSNY